MGESERAVRVKVNGQFKLNDLNLAVYERRLSKVDGSEFRKWTVQRTKTGRSSQHKLAGSKGPWSGIVHFNENGRTFRLKTLNF